ncbi:hypothetical protein T552_02664 [Pneumocystis carinii B80]|uniref:Uncharacterized protein n=1 Tax=Pneumocystis carinii (strain B80) TaxID=1408658 RepID=A0A0W4ZE47_PNEC8|nr:hypothetical protein T552_02664 [Pneumocystis carinii B80]KTW26655.1 hypothetical protein T552_02664 [Pneumocystis carinii B80]
MTSTQPAALAIRTAASRTIEEARKRVLRQYRAWQRAIPIVVEMYQLDVPIQEVKSALRNAYRKNKNITDLKKLDILIFQGHAEYQETLNFWKQQTHIMTFLKKHTQKTFELEKVEEQVKSPLKDTNLQTNIIEYSETRQKFLKDFLSGKP